MEVTTVRQRPLSALLVGATGRVVLRIVTAFESRRIQTLRADDLAEAREKIPVDMPHVVLSLVGGTPEEQSALADVALAVGAVVLYLDPTLDDDAITPILDEAVYAALEHRARRDAEELAAAEAAEGGGGEELDDALLDEALLEDGWDD